MSGPPTVAVTLEQLWHRVPGGTAVAAVEVARALAAGGEVDQRGVAAHHRRPPPAFVAPPVPVAQLPLPRPLLYEAWHRLRRLPVQRATGAVDVIHATGMAVPPRTAPLVVTVHDLGWRRHPEHATARGRRFFERSLELALADADLLLCSSEATAHDVRAAGADDARLRVVPLGVRVRPVAEAARRRVRERHGLQRPFVLWTGTIEPRKNLPVLVEAYRRLARPDVELVLAGPTGWHEDLDALIVPVRDRVRALGFVPTEDLDALYAEAAAFCYPSLLEGFGLPVLEAMAQGAPVVTSAGTATEEVAGDAALLVDPTDPAALSAALAQVLEDPAVAGALRAAGPPRAAAFGWERTAERTLAAYRELAP